MKTDSAIPRLQGCFSKVFPNLGEQEILQASADELAEWDSLATLNLLALIEEEFGMAIDLDELSGAPSFQSFLSQLQGSADPQVK